LKFWDHSIDIQTKARNPDAAMRESSISSYSNCIV